MFENKMFKKASKRAKRGLPSVCFKITRAKSLFMASKNGLTGFAFRLRKIVSIEYGVESVIE